MSESIVEKHKYLNDSKMTFQEVFNFAFNNYKIWGEMAKNIGKERFIELLRKISYEHALEVEQSESKKLLCNDFIAFKKILSESNYFSDNALTMQIIEDTKDVFEVKVTECLWAKVFKEIGMEEIGYSLICYPDYASCKGFNPNIEMIRTKTLMQGNDCCNHRYLWKQK